MFVSEFPAAHELVFGLGCFNIMLKTPFLYALRAAKRNHAVWVPMHALVLN